MTEPRLPAPGDYGAARSRVGDRVHRTPVVTCESLSRRLGLQLWLKAESLQKTGSFKIRGVFNKLLTLDPAARDRGVVSISAGNHAAALAHAASSLGTQATIVMPASAVASKIEATRRYGGEVVLTEEDLLATSGRIARERDLTFVHAFDDPAIMAGHGGVALEILEQVPAVEAVVVPVGGGGLIGGIARATKARRPDVRVEGVEPEGAALMRGSLERGTPQRSTRLHTIADGLAAPFIGEHTLAEARRSVDAMVTVSDASIVEAMLTLMERAKLTVEPSGAASVAALLTGAVRLAPGTVVVAVISGGNLDRAVLRRALASTAP